MGSVDDFLSAREVLLRHRDDYDAARREFRWPELEDFNWALDYFDRIAVGNDARALWVIHEDGSEDVRTFGDLSRRSNQIANYLRSLGLVRGDRVLLMLGNVPPLWEVMLAAIKLGVVVIPATMLLSREDLADRLDRGKVRAVVADSAVAERFAGLPGGDIRIAVGAEVPGWRRFAEADIADPVFTPSAPTPADDPLLLYFTSGTTSKPKLVEHTHVSYPVGHLSTMYWIGLQPGDVHLNISSPGWAKHAWSNVFAPWNAEATVLVFNYARFDATQLLDVISRCGVTTLCAPPTVWRMLIQADLTQYDVNLRELVGAGEPLNPEVIEQVQKAWGLTIRDGFGQTETTAQVGNTPGQPVKPGSMGRPLPGYQIALLDTDGNPSDEGEIALDLSSRPLGLMVGYRDDEQRTADAMRDGHYHTGDVGSRDADGYITYVGRADDVFKASDYRISPFELESVLIEHPAVAEAAVVPSPDPVRLAVPKAYIVLGAGWEPTRETALSILRHARVHLAPYKRIRRLEFADLPKTISGKIRRVDLRAQEKTKHANADARPAGEYRDDDFPSSGPSRGASMNIVDDALIEDANLRPEIGLSWRRSLMSGLDPGSTVDRPTVAEVDRRSRAAGRSHPVLDQIAGELAGTTFCVVLADRGAWIVDRRFGQARLESSMDGAGVVPGCQFLEERTGTNSIATTFELRRGISVLGEEHFIESFKKFSCYGHPILNPVTRRLEGVLDITCPAEHASPLLAPFLVRAARDIEARLLEGARDAERRMLAAYQAAASRQARPVLMLGGDVVLANAAAMELLEAADQAVLRGIALDSPPGRRMERSLRLASGQPGGVTFERIPGAGGVLFEFQLDEPRRRPVPRRRVHADDTTRLQRDLERYRATGTPVLISGEPGSGRTTVAGRRGARGTDGVGEPSGPPRRDPRRAARR